MTIVGIRILVLGRVKWIVRDSSNGGFVDFLAISRCSARRALHELDECIIFSSYFLSPVYYILCVSLFFSNFHFCTYLILIYCLSYISTGIFSEQWGFEKCVSRQDLRGIHPMVVGIEHTKRAVGAVSVRWKETIFTQNAESRSRSMREGVDHILPKEDVDRMKR